MTRKIAIVTGVSRLQGIGCAICVELAKKEIDVFFTYWTDYDNQMPWRVNADEPAAIQSAIRSHGVRCEKLELDLSVPASTTTVFDEAERTLGPVSILVNNATHSTQTGINTLLASELDRHYEINMRAMTMLALEFVRRFQFEKNGRIINLTSGQSLGEMSDEIAYALTKGAAETLTRTISQRLAQRGITINAVNPGPTDTGWMDDELKAGILAKSPMGRIGMPSDAARLIGFLASDAAEWVTGQVIHSEGGFVR